jgi:uncharacterized protein
MKVTAHGFHWDRGNMEKCREHGLTTAQIEDFFKRELHVIADQAHSLTESRFVAVGAAANGRAMFVGFTFREHEGAKLIRPISARYMHAKEVQKYEKALAEIKERQGR